MFSQFIQFIKPCFANRLFLALASIVVSFLLSGSAFASGQTILVVGDSLSAEYGIARNTGWVELLKQNLIDTTQEKNQIPKIINASISGDTTSSGMNRLETLLERDDPDIVILELGANDALRGLSLYATKSNLEAMIKASQKRKAKVLLLGMRIPPNYGRDYSEKFNKIFQELASEYGCEIVPFFLSRIATNRELFQADGIHPTAEAQAELMQTVKSALKPILK
jgi:acyl-CoA thioesterase-1